MGIMTRMRYRTNAAPQYYCSHSFALEKSIAQQIPCERADVTGLGFQARL
jgi:hypothetical protein